MKPGEESTSGQALAGGAFGQNSGSLTALLRQLVRPQPGHECEHARAREIHDPRTLVEEGREERSAPHAMGHA